MKLSLHPEANRFSLSIDFSCSFDPAVTSFNQKSPGEQKKPATRIHKHTAGAHPFRQLILKKHHRHFRHLLRETRANERRISASAQLEKNGFGSVQIRLV